MKIKRYFAADMRQAIRMVREEQGPDAVILSNRRVDGGVEIVAAVDYDESLVNRMGKQASAPVAPEPAPQPTTTARTGFAEAVSEAPVERSPEPRAERAADGQRPALFAAGQRQAGTVREEELDVAPWAAAAPAQQPVAEEPQIVWSQDPSLVAMREEIKTLRAILESQLSSLAWGEMRRSHPMRTQLLERLMRLGLSTNLCRDLAEQVNYQNDPEHNWRYALGLLARRLPVTDDDILTHGGVVALVGPTGVGKTTSVAKLAARYALRHGPKSVALITTDSYRIGAHQQLRTYGRILGVPVHLANDAEELQSILATLHDKSLVLIDTAGMSQRDLRLSEQLAMLRSGAATVRTYAVLSATTQRAALDEVVRAFHKVQLDGCILTKVDETGGLGEALSVVVEQQLPVAYVSDGQRVPEDLHPARSNNLVSRSAAMMQRRGETPGEESMAAAFGSLANQAHG